jgi:tRNA A58 N-methylase Trm61
MTMMRTACLMVLAAVCSTVGAFADLDSSAVRGRGQGQSQARVGVAPPPRTSADDARLIEALAVSPGSTVAEIGAGGGAMTVRMAREVGAAGHVYSSELGDKNLRDLRKAVTDAGLSNVTVVSGDANQTDFPDTCCDALFMQNVYHHFADPTAMNASILRALKPGGRLAVMDFAPQNGTTAPPPERSDDGAKHGVTAETVKSELTAAGFEFISTEPRGERRAFLVVVRKPG